MLVEMPHARSACQAHGSLRLCDSTKELLNSLQRLCNRVLPQLTFGSNSRQSCPLSTAAAFTDTTGFPKVLHKASRLPCVVRFSFQFILTKQFKSGPLQSLRLQMLVFARPSSGRFFWCSCDETSARRSGLKIICGMPWFLGAPSIC